MKRAALSWRTLSGVLVIVLAVVVFLALSRNPAQRTDDLALQGIVSYSVSDAQGQVRLKKPFHNTIQAAGKDAAVDFLLEDTRTNFETEAVQFDSIAVYSDNTCTTMIDFNGAGGGSGPNPAEDTNVDNTTTQVAIVDATFTNNTGGAVTVACGRLARNTSDGTNPPAADLLSNNNFADVTLNNGESLQIAWTIQYP